MALSRFVAASRILRSAASVCLAIAPSSPNFFCVSEIWLSTSAPCKSEADRKRYDQEDRADRQKGNEVFAVHGRIIIKYIEFSKHRLLFFHLPLLDVLRHSGVVEAFHGRRHQGAQTVLRRQPLL